MHERLWRQFQLGERCEMAYAEDETPDVSWRFVDRLHRFWRVRGYVLRVKQLPDKSGFWLWLDPIKVKQAA